MPGTRGRGLLLGLSALFAVYLACSCRAGRSVGSRQVALQRAARRLRVRLPELAAPERGKERAAWLCLGMTLLLWAAGDFYYTLFLWDATVGPADRDRLALARVLSRSSTRRSHCSCARARCTSSAASGSTRSLAALAVAAVGAAVLFGAVVESTGGSPLSRR